MITAAAGLLLVLATSARGAHAQRRPVRPGVSPPTSPVVTPAAPSAAPVAPAAEPALSDDRISEARRSFQRGVELLQAGRYGDAVGELQRARDIRATPPVHYNLGLALRGAGRNREAIGAFRAYLQSAGDTAPPAVRAQVERAVSELAQGLARVTLRVEPREARVMVDGEQVESAGAALELDPGPRVLTVDAAGYFPETRRLELRAGEQRTVQLRLAAQSGYARVIVESSVPTARIVIDGQHVGSGLVEESLTPGPHAIEVSSPRHATFTRQLVAVAGSTTRVRAVLETRAPWYATPWPWVGAALVVGGVATAGIVAATAGQTEPPLPGTWGVVMALTAF